MAILKLRQTDGTWTEIPALVGPRGKQGNGIKSIVFNDDYTLSITLDDDTSYTTPSIRAKDGTSVTVSTVSESSADGGSNIVTFSDGQTLTVKNGNKGTAGKTPEKGTDYYTKADKEEMTNAVLASLTTEEWEFEMEDGTVITKAVHL